MNREDLIYRTYVRILEEELQPAMGCTEPVALAWAAAKVRQTLGCAPAFLRVAVSGNLMKNVKSVVVPNTGGLRGIESSVAAGASVGDADALLEVLSRVTEDQHQAIRDFLDTVPIRVEKLESPVPLDMELEAVSGGDKAVLRITGEHTNLVYLAKNDTVLVDRRNESPTEDKDDKADRSLLTVEDIVDFAQCVELDDVRPLLERQLSYNMAIAEEGLKGEYGAGVGATLMESGDSVDLKVRAMAAAGSDARMSGCGLPVVIVSGSGNQGITASVPVAVYAREKGYSEEQLLRALALSDLLTVHQKAYIGVLSAYCGAVSAGCAAAGAMAWLDGGGYDAVAHTVVNGLAMTAGIVCDGAKASCAGKIAMAVESGLLGYHMYQKGHQFWGGEGIVIRGVDNTIRNVGTLAREGMKETDRKIVELMLEGLGGNSDSAGC